MFSIRHLSLSPAVLGVWSLFLGIALWFAPPTLVTTLRTTAWDGLRPGVLLVNAGRAHWQAWIAQMRDQEIRELQSQLAAIAAASTRMEERLQRLTAQFTLEQEQEVTRDVRAAEASHVPALFVPSLVEARVIGHTLGQDWRSGHLLEQGWNDGIREAALVLKSRRPLVDLGQSAQLTTEDPLIVGSTVVGKIEIVGKWTSTYLPVTDPDYRGAVQLVRTSETGTAWGAKGILKGNGSDCVVEGIPIDATVRVGDLVYNAGRDGAIEAPLFYGTVTTAELGINDREWRIVVTPGSVPSTITHVCVLRAALNPQRLWTH